MILDNVILPLPPTINSYYHPNRTGGVYTDASAVAYRKTIAFMLAHKASKTKDRLALAVGMAFSTNKVQDLDNRLKGLQDALQHAQVFHNDSQIDFLVAWRMQKSSMSGGHCAVWLGDMQEVIDVAYKWINTGDK